MKNFAYFVSFLPILVGHFSLVFSYSSIHVDIDPIIKLGVLVDFESDIMKGIRNDSLSQLMDEMRVKLNSNFTSEATMMTSYKDFELQVEDNPFFCDKYLAVISVISCSATQSLYDLMREFCPSTLLLSIHDRKCERPSKDQGIGFPILSSVHDIVPMLTDMRNDFLHKWNQINLIHDHSLDIDSLHDLVHSLTTMKTSHTEQTKITTFHFESKGYLLQIASKIMHQQHNTSLSSSTQSKPSENEDDINTKIAHKLRSSDHLITVDEVFDNIEKDKRMKNFLVVAQSNMILELVESASSRGMLKYPYQWLLVLSDVQHDPNYWKRIGPILASTQVAIVTREMSLYGQCHELEEGCQIRLAMETFHQSLEKIARLGEYDFSETSKRGQIKNRLLAEMRLTLGNQEAASQYCGNCNRYVVQTFQRLNSGNHIGDIVRREPSLDQTWTESNVDSGHVKVTNTGEWTPFKGLLQEDDMDSEKPSIAGRKIRVGIINQPPYVNVQVEGEKCLVNGTSIELFKLLSSRMNFTVEWVCWQNLDHIGTMMPNGSSDGLLAKLASGEIEIAANGIWKTPSRVKSGLYEFFFPYDVDVVGLVVKKTPEDNEWLFLTPFTVDTWVCVIACMVLIGPIVWIVHRSAKYYDFYGCRDGEGLFKLSECIWYTYGAMVQQGGDTLPAAISGRVLIGGWWIFVIVTVTTYSGNLVALLTFPKIVQPIENAQDLYDTWGVSWGTPAPNELSETVQIARYSGLDILRDDMEYYYDFEREKYKLFDEVAADRLALILKRHEARRWVSVEYLRTGFCGMHIAKDALYHTPIHLVAKKGVFSDPLIEEFNRNIMVIARAGIMVYWRKWFETPGDDCLHPSLIHAGEVKKVDVVHMIGAYVILAWGIGIGCVSLIGELIYFGMKNRDKTTKMNPLEMMRDAFIRLKSNPSYHKWADGKTAVIDPKAKSMKMPFVPPGIKTEPSYVTEYGMSGVTGKGFRPRVNQSYQDQIRSIYDDPANFHYFSYAPLRPSYKPKFR